MNLRTRIIQPGLPLKVSPSGSDTGSDQTDPAEKPQDHSDTESVTVPATEELV